MLLITLTIVREGSKPVPNLDVMLCPHPRNARATCYEAAMTDARGIATFEKAPFALVEVKALGDCSPVLGTVDLRPSKLPKPVVVEAPRTGKVRVKLLEHQEGGEPRPLRVKVASVTIRSRPAPKKGSDIRQNSQTLPQPTDRFDVCAESPRLTRRRLPAPETTLRTLVTLLAASLALSACSGMPIEPAQARGIAKEAYVYGFPLVDSYRTMHAYWVDTGSREYKGPVNTVVSMARVYGPDDTAVQTPNSDTPYSFAWLDLRAEPVVIDVPPIEKERYFSVQLVDLYTHNFDYIGSRATGNGGGSFLIAGPRWKGEAPAGIAKVIRSETELALALFRTQLFHPGDIENVRRIQAGYVARPLSTFAGTAAPPPAPAITFAAPLTAEAQRSSVEFFNVLGFVLQFCPTHPSEKALRARMASLAIGPGKRIDVERLSAPQRAGIEQGIADAWNDFEALSKRLAAVDVATGELFGSRDELKNNYLYRMAGAVFGIFGNSKAEAIYPMYRLDGEGQRLDGAYRYTVRFAPGELPPVNAFWSLTMYELPASRLVANPLNRYLVSSALVPTFRRDPDDGLTFYIQADSPGHDDEANWLPAPRGTFAMAMRLYWPKPAALEGDWTPPPIRRQPVDRAPD